MSAWEFCGMTEAEYDKKFFKKKPAPAKCAYPGCTKKHLRERHFCAEHWKALNAYLYKPLDESHQTKGET